MSEHHTGNPLADEFLDELDKRIADENYPPDSRERLAAMRPMIIAKVLAHPDGFAEFLTDWLDALESGIGHG